MHMSTDGTTQRAPVAIIGAGPAGLATAGSLAARGIRSVVLERANDVGSSWRGHYDRLHLHTVRWLSHLPGESVKVWAGRRWA